MNSIASISNRQQRVLIVDDEPHNRELLEVMLAPEGLLVESASSGAEALAIVAARPPDLVLLDIMMPGMDGYTVATKLKSDPGTRNIPIIVVTALDNADARLRGLDAGAEDFLTKPINRAELKVRVRNLLRLKAYGDYHDTYSQLLEAEVTERTTDLIESERLYRSTFDAAPIGIVHVGLDGRWLRVNRRLCEVLGYTREELESGSVQSALVPENHKSDRSSVRELAAAGNHGPHLVEEREYRRRDGTTVCARVNMSVHEDADGNIQHFLLVIEDITDQKALETKLRQASKMDAIGRLASGVAHDFNNLLTVVVSHSEMLAEDLGETDPMRVDLEEIRAAGWRGVELTKQLLAFSRQQVLQPQICDLTEIVTDMEKMLRRVLGEDVVMTTAYAAEPSNVLVDRGQVEQVLMNLVVNARDAMPQGGTLAIETTEMMLDASTTGEAGPHVMVSVTDTGMGMDKATQTRIYEPFFTTKEFGKGTGLGLATVFGIVRQSGGTILMNSELGVGTTFNVYFPVAKGRKRVRVASTGLRPTFRGTETILLVEDEAGVRSVARTILRKYGYDVLEAQSGGDALLLCEQHPSPIHLLLTDVVMPRMSGRQLSERLLLVRPEMRVLYMSGYMDDAVVRHGILDSSVAFIQKPITPEALAHKVRETLAREPAAPLPD